MFCGAAMVRNGVARIDWQEHRTHSQVPCAAGLLRNVGLRRRIAGKHGKRANHAGQFFFFTTAQRRGAFGALEVGAKPIRRCSRIQRISSHPLRRTVCEAEPRIGSESRLPGRYGDFGTDVLLRRHGCKPYRGECAFRGSGGRNPDSLSGRIPEELFEIPQLRTLLNAK